MSLESAGQSITLEFAKPLNDPSSGQQLTNNLTVRVYTQQSGAEACKQLFLKAMEEFADTTNFKAATHQLDNELVIKIHHSINLVMPC
ncbi:MAG: hypothetical protein PHQ58_04645 [Rhodoferax sp.]|uniref:hypothetical protein n=1 Tax=Rhodoferax sp. TaxID=50421 RepID=UPI0026246007|nr:hypothetical protein [Rhodoferax sp.]MDD2879701.1 hypothetical protein [Rhodoferax sp.]